MRKIEDDLTRMSFMRQLAELVLDVFANYQHHHRRGNTSSDVIVNNVVVLAARFVTIPKSQVEVLKEFKIRLAFFIISKMKHSY